jgi:hypothetical protein
MKNATKTSAKKTSKKPVRGTVGWLIEELKKFPKDMHVLHGDLDSNYYDVGFVEVLPIRALGVGFAFVGGVGSRAKAEMGTSTRSGERTSSASPPGDR